MFLLCAHLNISLLHPSHTPSSCSSQQTGTEGECIGLQQLDMMRIFFFFAKSVSMYNTIKSYTFS